MYNWFFQFNLNFIPYNEKSIFQDSISLLNTFSKFLYYYLTIFQKEFNSCLIQRYMLILFPDKLLEFKKKYHINPASTAA